jgi:hypothetical protein
MMIVDYCIVVNIVVPTAVDIVAFITITVQLLGTYCLIVANSPAMGS